MIFDVIYKLYFVLKRLMRNEKFNKNKLIKFIINIIQDIFNSKLPLYYKKNQDKIFLKRKNSNVKIIASLTTYPKRINTVWITINSIINPDGSEVSKDEINNYVKDAIGAENELTEDIKVSEENMEAIKKGMRGVTSESGGTAARNYPGGKCS